MFSRLHFLNVAYITFWCIVLAFQNYHFYWEQHSQWNYPGILNRIVSSLRNVLEKIGNIKLTDYHHSIASIPCRSGIRRAQDIILPGFLSSINSTSSLINNILIGNTTVMNYKESLERWNSINIRMSPLKGHYNENGMN